MAPREDGSRHNKSLGIASFGINIQPVNFLYKSIYLTAVKGKAELRRFSTPEV
jgi:hypothetical protein